MTIDPNDLEPQYTRPYKIDKVHSPPYRATHFKQCPMCSNRNCAPIKHGDGTVKYHFCPSCKYVGPSDKFIGLTDNRPIGFSNNLGKPTTFTLIQKRRITNHSDRTISHSNRKFNHDPKQTIPLLGGKEDIELKYLAQTGVIIALNEQDPE